MELKIDRDGAYCGKHCVFLDNIFTDDTATCLLFNVALSPVRRYDYVENWLICSSCNSVCTKHSKQYED